MVRFRDVRLRKSKMVCSSRTKGSRSRNGLFFAVGGAWRVLPRWCYRQFFFSRVFVRSFVRLAVWLCVPCESWPPRAFAKVRPQAGRVLAHTTTTATFFSLDRLFLSRSTPSTRSTSQTAPSASFMCQPTRLGPLSSFFDKLHVVPRQLASHGRTNNEVSVVPHPQLQPQ